MLYNKVCRFSLVASSPRDSPCKIQWIRCAQLTYFAFIYNVSGWYTAFQGCNEWRSPGSRAREIQWRDGKGCRGGE
jgi:hypothetical protein